MYIILVLFAKIVTFLETLSSKPIKGQDSMYYLDFYTALTPQNARRK